MDNRTTDNLTIWQPTNRNGHVESYFLKLNDPDQSIALWLKFTIYSPKNRPQDAVGEVWGIFFDSHDGSRTAAFKETYPIAVCGLARDKFALSFGNSSLSAGATRGRLRNGERELTWDLTFSDGQPPIAHFPLAWMYTAKLPKSKIKTPYPASRFSGTFTLDGKSFTVASVPGMQGHNWGSEHAHLYAWAHCSAFEGHGDDTYFEGFSSRVKMGPLTTPFLSMAILKLRGKMHVLNGLKTLRSPDVQVEGNRWRFHLQGDGCAISGELSAPKDLFIALNYYDPSGNISYCLNSKVASADIRLHDAQGKVIETLHSKNTSALELLVKNKDHGVKPGV